MISNRLESIRKSIKLEAQEASNNQDVPRTEDRRRFQDFQPGPSNNNRNNNIALREQFLNKTLTAQNVIGALSGRVDTRLNKHENNQIAGIYNRAEDVSARLGGHLNNSSFYAHVPQNLKEPTMTSSRHESPLVLNNNNAMFNFQASTENKNDVMMNSNPYRDIPYKVQNTANIIGANLEMIKKSIEKKNKRKIPPPPVYLQSKSDKIDTNIEASTSLENCTNNHSVRKEMKDQCVGTTVNTGTLQFEITSNELLNLNEEKKMILLEFMTVSYLSFM